MLMSTRPPEISCRGRGLLGEQPRRDAAGPHGDQQADPLGRSEQRRCAGPGLGQRRRLFEQAVREARWDQQRVEAQPLGGLHDRAQVVKRRRTLGPQRPDARPVAVNRHKPREPGRASISHGAQVSPLARRRGISRRGRTRRRRGMYRAGRGGPSGRRSLRRRAGLGGRRRFARRRAGRRRFRAR